MIRAALASGALLATTALVAQNAPAPAAQNAPAPAAQNAPALVAQNAPAPAAQNAPAPAAQNAPAPAAQNAPAPAAQAAPANPPADVKALVEGEMPDAPARALVQAKCMLCHTGEYVTMQRLTEKQWQGTVDKMRKFGSPANDEEAKAMVAYLSQYWKPDLAPQRAVLAPPPPGSLPAAGSQSAKAPAKAQTPAREPVPAK